VHGRKRAGGLCDQVDRDVFDPELMDEVEILICEVFGDLKREFHEIYLWLVMVNRQVSLGGLATPAH